MRILFIGGTGFIGRYLCKELVKNNNQVIVIHTSDMSERDKVFKVEYEQINLDINYFKLAEVIKDVELLILAIQPKIRRMQDIIKAFVNNKSLIRIIYLSTLLIYPNSTLSQTEEVTPKPETSYEKEKLKEEEMLTVFSKENNIKLTIARLANVYGDVQNKGVINNLLLSILKNKEFVINGDGNQVRDYIFIEDVVRLLNDLISCDQQKQKEIFNICTGDGYTILQLIETVEKISKKKLIYKKDKPSAEKRSIIGNGTKLAIQFGGLPVYNIFLGMEKTYNKYLKGY